MEDPVVLSFCFIVKEDVDRMYFAFLCPRSDRFVLAFSLGELSGSVKNILGLGSFLAKVKYQVKSKLVCSSETYVVTG